jgi:hypothetical protein
MTGGGGGGGGGGGRGGWKQNKEKDCYRYKENIFI